MIHEDLTGGSAIAIGKALEMYEPSVTKLYLVHVYRVNPVPLFAWLDYIGYPPQNKREDAENELSAKVEGIRMGNSGCKVVGSFLETESSITKALAGYIMDNGIDLVVSNREHDGNWFSYGSSFDPYTLTEQTGCAVLSVTPCSLKHPIRSILLPIGSFIPEKKIQVAIALSKEFKACIHLMGVTLVNSDSNKENLSAFYNTYKIFRECGYEPPYKIVNGTGTPSEMYGYAQEIKADLVLVNPEKRTGFFKWLGNWFNRVPKALSPMQVLSVKPHLK